MDKTVDCAAPGTRLFSFVAWLCNRILSNSDVRCLRREEHSPTLACEEDRVQGQRLARRLPPWELHLLEMFLLAPRIELAFLRA